MISKQPNKAWIVSLSTFPPQQCGLATFTRDLSTTFNQLFAPGIESRIVAVNDDETVINKYPKSVIAAFPKHDKNAYSKIALRLNKAAHVKLVSIQHEFGIFGGDMGEYILEFTAALTKPLAITFHTVLPQPSEQMLRIVASLAKRAEIIIVMTEASKLILEQVYKIETDAITIIPHGIHPALYKSSAPAKKILQLPLDRVILSTFGLLGPDKGIEYVIEALPAVVKRHPHIQYLVIGATHPDIRKREGEAYREYLKKRIAALGLESIVKFVDSYLKTSKLLTFLQASDIYISTPLNPDQAVSGTLTYALGTGRPVVATSFAQAKEDVGSEAGILVGFKNSQEISDALLRLLDNAALRQQMGKYAYFKTRNMTWGNVAIAYIRAFAKKVPGLKENEKRIPRVSLRHLKRLTDDFGIIQFTHLTEPDKQSGYTLDDNARALRFTAMYYDQTKSPTSLKLARVYLDFMEFVQNTDGSFENYVTQEKILSDEQNNTENLQEANARAVHALAVAATTVSLPEEMRRKARQLYEQSLAHVESLSSPRAIASYIKSLAVFLEQEKNLVYLGKLRAACDALILSYEEHSTKEWDWFEPILAYSNGIIPEALLIGYKITGNKDYFAVGKKTLDFLIDNTFEHGLYVPIGQDGWFKRGGYRHRFDQQPEDTAAMVAVCKTMYELTNEHQYQKYAFKAFDWFLGGNVSGRIMYDQSSGGCYDGLREKEVNLNEGAESTLSYLLSRIIL